MVGTLAFYIFVCVLLLVLYVNKSKGKNRSSVPMKHTAGTPKTMSDNKTVELQTAGEGKAYLRMDDRKNDWLARQLNEEKRAQLRIINMFGLQYNAKADHAANCDARELKNAHEKNCDAEGVDRAAGK